MEEFTIKLKDHNKRSFLLELLTQLDFIEIQTTKPPTKELEKEYDFFQSAGLLADRDIDANQLRRKAWRIDS